MYAYKGFEPDLSCRGYRFVMGKNVTPEANCASNGFHCAEDPLDCVAKGAGAVLDHVDVLHDVLDTDGAHM